MNDWRALGYVPDSEGEDDYDLTLSTPKIVEATAAAGTRLSSAITNERTNKGEKRDDLGIFDLPPSSIENEGPSEGQRRGRGRPPKRGRGAKRLSVGGSQRPKKQARIEEPSGNVMADIPSTPKSRIGGTRETSSPYPSSGNKSILNLFSIGDGDMTLDTNSGVTSPNRGDIKGLDEHDIEEVDLIDEHGPDSDIEDAPVQPILPAVIPPSSPPVPPRIFSLESATNSPALPSRNLLIESYTHYPAPPTPVSVFSNLEVRIPFSHSGLTDPATRINLDSTTTNSDEPIPADDFTSGVARNLRTRKPIQMNPYQLELERYNSDWKSRGLKPVRYIYDNSIPPPNKKVPEKDSQEDEWIIPEGDEEETRASTLRQTQSFQSVDQDSIDVEGHRGLHDNDEELLVLDELFRRSAKERPSSPGQKRTAKGGKRRKTSHPSDPSLDARRILETSKASVARGRNLTAVSGETEPYLSRDLASPTLVPKTPTAGTKKTRDKFDIFDLNSSGSDSDSIANKPPASTSRRQVILDSDESDGGDTTPRAGSPTRRRLSVSSSSASEDEEESPNDPEARENEIQMYQRRVRGVLPASWIRFNQSKEQENKNPANLHHSPQARPVVKGMAQMRIRTLNSPPAGSMTNPLNLSSSESSDDDGDGAEIVEQHSKDVFIASSARSLTLDSITGTSAGRQYAFEDNGFDRMLNRSRASNSGTSKKKPSKPRNLRQSKLFREQSNTYSGTPSRNQHVPSKPRQRSVALSVVDACERYRKNKKASPPQFMRIAERLAKKRRNLGRHLPDRKVVEIDRFLEDETDREDTLMKWKKTKAKDDSPLSSSSHRDKTVPSSARPQQARSNFSALPSIYERQPTYLQTKLASYRLEQEPIRRQNQKSRLKSHVIAKPIALIPSSIHQRRIGLDDFLLQRLSSRPKIVDPIEDDDFRTPQPTIPQHPPDITQPRLYSSKPAVQNTGGVGGARGSKNGQSALPKRRHRQRRKLNAPKRIERNALPIAFQPPERQLRELPESMEIDMSDGKALWFQNMKAVGTTYSINFDITIPQCQKSLFQASTFLGSGTLARALQTNSGRTYRSGIRAQGVEILGRLFNWEVYEEAVAAELEIGLASVLDGAEQLLGVEGSLGSGAIPTILAIRQFFRYVIDYLSTKIFFSDLIDISTFAVRFLDIFSDFTSKVGSLRVVAIGGLSAIIQMQFYAYTSILVHQISCIADGGSDQVGLQNFCGELSESLISVLASYGTYRLQKGFSRAFQNIFAADKLNEEAICLESWIIAYQVSLVAKSDMPLRKPSFWEHFNTFICPNAINTLRDVEILDSLWREIFRLLPLSAIDAKGNMEALDVDNIKLDNWGFVKELMVQSLTIYNSSGLEGRLKAKNYIWALFARCLVLLRDWKWGRPDVIIVPLFDTYGKRLQNLAGENNPRDPSFLEHLDGPSFSSTPSEMCFSIFSKIVALGTKRMQLHNSKGLGDLVIRIIPNHGRVFLKENNNDWANVDMLANHHYLLTALYYGASHDLKRRIAGIVRRLVDPEKSHAKVCALNLRAWANILICELADGKREEILKDLMKWHSSIVQTTVRLHRENDSWLEEERKKLFDPQVISKLEKDAIDNRKNVESVLASAMDLLKMVFRKEICDFYSAEFVLGADSLKTIYALASNLPQALVANAVQILSFHIKVCRDFGISSAKDDSQESWAGFNDIESEGFKKTAAKRLLDELYDPMFRLLNTYFAGRGKNLDNVLGPCIKTWVELGAFLVQYGLKTWDDYFNRYQKSWFSMVDTDTKKVYSVFYVTNIIQIDPGVYDTHKTQILELWAQSLVERASLLKFQHELTAVLFNHDLGNTLFSNMPFEVDEETEQYRISAVTFKERRLSLLGMLLDNMQREMVKVTDERDQGKAKTLKTEYVLILQGLMKAMKDNYMAIHASKNSSNKSLNTTLLQQQLDEKTTSDYVTFCQQIVEHLQKYTTDICAIDKFFVDSVIFPLPKNDPTYVTSKLKGYFLKLKTERRGWFVQFLQFWNNTVGRVAVDKQQEYFVEQTLGAFDIGERYMVEQGGGGRTSREFCVIAMFGAYTRRCMEGIGNLVVAVPILGVLEKVALGLELEFDALEEEKEVDGRISGLLVAILEPVRVAIEAAISMDDRVLNEPLALHVVELLARVVGACDYMVNLLHLRDNHVSEELAQDLLKIAVRGLSRFKACMTGRVVPEQLDMVMFEPNLPFQAERRRFDTEYNVEIEKWRVEGRELFVKRAAVRKEVEWDHLISGMGLAESKERLLGRIEKVMQLVGVGVCGGVVREVEGNVVEVRKPICRWADELLGIGERELEGGFHEVETEVFDMDD
ncbi:hypothetical protein AOL_s00081g118 [Orbilia oligospora ATCC 24927]|uniref:Uncharacterized protein n=1 Tax=Arthrobotrys oligospora (strain ATCC 24927 / CBS 115.81 / DSM 1491) TaxID=756982 RepID=G1XFH6_ARTOA|nr:hypothetical protein AOL_s00081g118 [Orbilia oligospora ATCC 24927]EGX48122.1 hypothetical protein AOL_s00081g118 [Orbilia oligospora ATCC 24927]